ncbi:MAG TPA: DUF1707 domain-containing protein [Micromonosporaceae bacterium]|jgi:hypothetical protein
MSNELERVGTAEREAAAAVLSDAAAEGYLDTDEFAERSAATYAARTRADLDRALAELPAGWMRARVRTGRRERHAAAARLGMRLHLVAYLAGSLLMIGIWLTVGMTAGAWYPWPIWPILGWGLGLAGHVVPVSLAVRRLVSR